MNKHTTRDFLIYFIATLIVVAGGFGIYDDVAVSAGGLSADDSSQSKLASLPPPFAGVSRLRLVMLGADDRPGEVGRSDTLMVLWLNPGQNRGAIMSIPRDLRADIPGHGSSKINHSYAYGGAKLTVETVQLLLGVPMDGYLKINFEGFVKAVDVLGGVDLLVPDIEGRGRGMNYDDNWGHLHVHLTPGMHHMDGETAMGFCRYRKSNYSGLGDGDLGRAERQQQFLRAILEQKLRVTNLPALMRASSEIMGCLDTSLSWRECADLARLLKGMTSTDIKTVTIPVTDAMSGGIYYSHLVQDDFNRMLDDIDDHLSGQPITLRTVVLKDGTQQAGVAAAAAKLLTEAGFTVVTSQSTTKTVAATKVLYPAGQKDMATAAALALGAGEAEELREEPQETAPNLQVILGEDYQPPRSRGRNDTGLTTEGP
jgi:LCP family protein required for cell wall assembly